MSTPSQVPQLDALSHYQRIQLVQLEVDRLHGEAQTCRDPERMAAIRQEMEVLLESMREIRREQIIGDMPKPKPPRRWFGLRKASR